MTGCEVGAPERRSYRANVCVLCCFSFIQTEITPSGEKVETKFLTKKLKLTDERVDKIKLVIDSFELGSARNYRNGVCVKCFSKVERVLQLKTQLSTLRSKLEQNFPTLPSQERKTLPHKKVSRPPCVTQPPRPLEVKTPVPIRPFPTLSPVNVDQPGHIFVVTAVSEVPPVQLVLHGK
jgi:hypothetical protein